MDTTKIEKPNADCHWSLATTLPPDETRRDCDRLLDELADVLDRLDQEKASFFYADSGRREVAAASRAVATLRLKVADLVAAVKRPAPRKRRRK